MNDLDWFFAFVNFLIILEANYFLYFPFNEVWNMVWLY